MESNDYFKFPAGWWLSSPAVRSLSPDVRDFCVTLMCFMSKGNPPGTLTTESGKPMTARHVTNLVNLPEEDARRMVTQLIDAGALAREPFSRIVYDPRQVKQRELSEMKRQAGLLGGNPALKQPALSGVSGSNDKLQHNHQYKQPAGRHHMPPDWELTAEENRAVVALASTLWRDLTPADLTRKLDSILAEFRAYWLEMARLDMENNTKKALRNSWYLTLVSRVKDVHDRESRGQAAIRLRADAVAPAYSPQERPAERRTVNCKTCEAARQDSGLPPCPFHAREEETVSAS